MSRNLRHKTPATPSKKSVRGRSDTLNDSSDDDYEGVNLISDSEDDDEPDVEEAEEQVIMHEEDDDDDLQSTPRPTQDDEVSWEGFSEEEVLGDDQDFFDEHMARTGSATEATLLPESDTEAGTRRVRFDLSDSSSTISNDVDDFDDEYPFPELFVPQAELDPTFRKQIEEDPDDDLASSDGGFWDFQASNMNLQDEDNGVEASSDSAGSESGSESGYETDEGETTEEEDLPSNRIVSARSILRQHSSESESSEAETVVRRTAPRTPQAGDRNGPRLGNFDHIPTRPFAVLDFKSKRLLMFKAKINRRHSFDTPRLPATYVEDPTFQEMSPMISNSANMMMSAMYNPDYPLGQFLGGEVLGPPEAFFPFTSISANGDVTQDDPSSYDEDDIDEVDFLNIEDLIDFPDESTSDELDEHDSAFSPTDGEPFSLGTPRPTTATSEDQVHPLLLSNPRLVGAFRNNQDTHRLLSGSNITADSMRFSSRFNTTAIQGIRNGHLNAATAPITPLRKQKRLVDASSPLQNVNKRKFSGEERGHKRNKSSMI